MFSWRTKDVSDELNSAMRVLAEEYPLEENGTSGMRLVFKAVKLENRGVKIHRRGNEIVIEYSDITCALRGVGLAMANDDKTECQERTTFRTLGIMLDCSRNAVMTVEHFKGWLRKLALLGYNQAMLYTEDTYEVSGEPYFGYLRGAYSADELREVDDYAARLGIEMVPCIQTLGHLSQILKWPAYDAIKDTDDNLCPKKEETYAFLEKIIRHISETFRTKRIHIGMDEAWALGRGKFLDEFGYHRAFDIFNEHLERALQICRTFSLKPMIWADMYFSMGSKLRHGYYDPECNIPADVRAKIPQDVELVYWDYYHDNEEFYLNWIDRHKELNPKVIMGSGVWTWINFWYNRYLTEKNVAPCIRACQKKGIDELFFTMWGDDGAYCDFDSALAGLAWSAELAFTESIDMEVLQKRFQAVCGGDYSATCLAAELASAEFELPPPFLWDDPILAIYLSQNSLKDKDFLKKASGYYSSLAKKLESVATKENCTGDLNHALLLAKIIAEKVSIRQSLVAGYTEKNFLSLGNLVTSDIPRVIDLLEQLDVSFRKNWLSRNKPFGLEVIQIRLAGQIRRYKELSQRISELSTGRISRIDELENLPTEPLVNPRLHCYRWTATSSVVG